jgi:hypothetical protein
MMMMWAENYRNTELVVGLKGRDYLQDVEG